MSAAHQQTPRSKPCACSTGKHLSLASLAAFLTAGGSLLAAPSGPVRLPTMVVTATGVPEEAFTLPYTTAQVDARALEAKMPRLLPIALQEEPGIMVQKTAAAQGSPYIRGFTGFRTLLLVDGVRLNHSVFREGPNQYWSTVDPLALDRLELVKGPASVIYGSDAVGGTVNALTGDPATQVPATSYRKNSSGTAFYRYSSAEDSHTVRVVEDKRSSEQTTMRTGFTYREMGDLRGGNDTGRQPETGYREHAIDFRSNYVMSPGVTLKAAFQHLAQDDAWRSHTTVQGSTWRGVRPGSDVQRSLDQDRQLAYLQLHAKNRGGAADQVHAGVSWQHQGEAQYRQRSNRRIELTGFDVDAFGAFVQAHSKANPCLWVYGGEFYRDYVDSYSRKYLADGTLDRIDHQGPVGDDATYDLAGLYIENHLPKLGRLHLIAGGRYNHASASADKVTDPLSGTGTSISKDWQSAVGSLRGVVDLDKADKWKVFGGLSQALRTPNLSDLTRFDIAEGNQIETPSPDLNAERFVTGEAGLRTRHAVWSAEASWFFTSIDNQIIRTPTGRIVEGREEVTKRNSGSGYLTGVELSARWQPVRTWTVWTQGTWMEGEIDVYPTADASVKVREPVSRVMPLTVVSGLRWEKVGGSAWVEFVGCFATRQDKLAGNDQRDVERIPAGGTPGYTVFHVRAGYRLSPQLTLTAAVENVADRDYRIHGSGLNEPGRNLVLAATARF